MIDKQKATTIITEIQDKILELKKLVTETADADNPDDQTFASHLRMLGAASKQLAKCCK